jgi:hypothetical protein
MACNYCNPCTAHSNFNNLGFSILDTSHEVSCREGKTMKRDPSAAAFFRIIEQNPDLSAWGMVPRYLRRRTGITAEDHDRSRRALKEQVRGFKLCVRWLSLLRCRQTINFSIGSSYSLKHLAESWAGEYISNGAFITAAIYLNITYLHRGESPNIYLALSSRYIDRISDLPRLAAGEGPEGLLPPTGEQPERRIDCG